MDKHGIKSLSDAERVVAAPSGLHSLIEASAEELDRGFRPIPEAFHQLAAGPNVDLSGNLECSHPDCLIRSLEDLLSRAALVFDKVVVTGLDPVRVNALLKADSPGPLVNEVLKHVAVALYVRESGAEDVLLFSMKQGMCSRHLNEHSVEVGIGPMQDACDALAAHLFSEGRFSEYSRAGSKVEYTYTHPDLEILQVGSLRVKASAKKADILESVARMIAADTVGELITSIAGARENQAALGVSSSADLLVQLPRRDIEVADVVLNLQLPHTESLPLKEILALRKHEASDLQAFQFALRQGIKEKLRSSESTDAARIADEVMEDLVEPALLQVERRVEAARKIVRVPTATAVVTGASLLTVGLLAAPPLAVPGAIFAATGLVAGIRDRLTSQAEIELGDMYFLWKLDRAGRRHG